MGSQRLRIRKESIAVHMIEGTQYACAEYMRIVKRSGFSRIQAHSSVTEFEQAVLQAGADLDALIICLDVEKNKGMNLVRRIRRRMVGKNPFMPIIATSWNTDLEFWAKVYDIGADSIMAKPLSPITLFNDLEALLAGRRTFIAFKDYVGPAQHINAERYGLSLFVQVPNISMTKTQVAPSNSVKSEVDIAWQKLMQKRSVGLAFECGVTARAAFEHLAEDGGIEKGMDLLSILPGLCERSRRNFPATAYPGAMDTLIQLERIVSQLLTEPFKRESMTYRLLEPLAYAVCMGVRPNQNVTVVSEEIDRWLKQKACDDSENDEEHGAVPEAPNRVSAQF